MRSEAKAPNATGFGQHNSFVQRSCDRAKVVYRLKSSILSKTLRELLDCPIVTQIKKALLTPASSTAKCPYRIGKVK
jgi:hypothetical protein